MAVSRRGQGQPVLCLHATGHGGRDFEAFSDRAINAGFEVVALDWPGQGASHDQPPHLQASAHVYSQLLEEAIPALWPASVQPIIIGNSIGGAAAIELAARRPDLVRALVLCNPGGLAPLNLIARLYIAHRVRFFSAGARGDAGFAKAFKRDYGRILPRPAAAAQRQRIVDGGPETAAIMAQAWASFAAPEADIRSKMKGIDLPIFYAWAKDDGVVSWGRSRKAAVTAPNHRVQLFPGGHSPFLEDPDTFFAAFLKFVRDRED